MGFTRHSLKSVWFVALMMAVAAVAVQGLGGAEAAAAASQVEAQGESRAEPQTVSQAEPQTGPQTDRQPEADCAFLARAGELSRLIAQQLTKLSRAKVPAACRVNIKITPSCGGEASTQHIQFEIEVAKTGAQPDTMSARIELTPQGPAPRSPIARAWTRATANSFRLSCASCKTPPCLCSRETLQVFYRPNGAIERLMMMDQKAEHVLVCH